MLLLLLSSDQPYLLQTWIVYLAKRKNIILNKIARNLQRQLSRGNKNDSESHNRKTCAINEKSYRTIHKTDDMTKE